jgi:hypothetical protein
LGIALLIFYFTSIKNCDCASCSGKFSALCNGTEKMCISKSSVCDGNLDCPNGEDEVGCPGVCPHPKEFSLKVDVNFFESLIFFYYSEQKS